jgi:hypothetical protein
MMNDKPTIDELELESIVRELNAEALILRNRIELVLKLCDKTTVLKAESGLAAAVRKAFGG